ncbi:hypothetical protein ACFLY4_10035, partial [Chloroflexota bacterium]
YTLTINCDQEDRTGCERYFEQFLFSFEYVSPSLNLLESTPELKSYRDISDQFVFQYPLDWQYFFITNSNEKQTDPRAIMTLEGDNPSYWSQVVLEPSGTIDSTSMIMIKHSQFSKSAVIEDRLLSWELSNSQSPMFSEYRIEGKKELQIAGQDAVQSNFTIIYPDGARRPGSLIITGHDGFVWEFVSLCNPRSFDSCQAALGIIIDTIEFSTQSQHK